MAFKKFKFGGEDALAWVDVEDTFVRWEGEVYCPNWWITFQGPDIDYKNLNKSIYEKLKKGHLAYPEPEKSILESFRCIPTKQKRYALLKVNTYSVTKEKKLVEVKMVGSIPSLNSGVAKPDMFQFIVGGGNPFGFRLVVMGSSFKKKKINGKTVYIYSSPYAKVTITHSGGVKVVAKTSEYLSFAKMEPVEIKDLYIELGLAQADAHLNLKCDATSCKLK